eukprot:CAMPEP_0195083470 /NCGR_PEP_ID=MMETSP0448-20130528/24408_1 /TAXON_ID=66468 /ORGANISM="Heterocapsa triquestra, Strain CCMP 448" /LENGTH=244 /DNA_ID=CAMNT_0040116681 /DNA_START=45 /DNA_END=779 /DNA_ORIENTATION=+
MVSSRAFVAAALGLCLLSKVEVLNFVGTSAARGAARAPRAPMRADASGLTPGGPLIVYRDALVEAAAKKGESVAVTKDVMSIKSKLSDEATLEELTMVVNKLGTTELEKAEGMIKLFSPMTSSVMPKFITFLAKKKRLLALKPLCFEYINELYSQQAIAPVKVRSASRLTEAQLETIKNKMKAKTGAEDIKLITEVDAGLLGGFVAEWGFSDPENLDTATEGVDLSLKSFLQKAALNQGVVTTV